MTRVRVSLASNLFAAAFAFALLVATATLASAQTFTPLYSFTGGADGSDSDAALIQSTNGRLYGAAYYGGANGDGSVFAITTGGALSTVTSFNGTDGANPIPGVIQASDGSIYGTTNLGGAHNLGTFFKISGTTVTTLFSFTGTTGSPVQGGIVQGTDGNFYGTTIFGGAGAVGTAFKITPTGTFTLLHEFGRAAGNGGSPYPALLQASDGNFYGTTFDGGTNDHGIIFRLTPAGRFTVIYNFCVIYPTCADGYNPTAGLIQGSDGDLYGMTARGGNSSCDLGGYLGCGAIYKISLAGALTTLYNFQGPDGAQPLSHLVQGTDGNFYGTTQWDGANTTCTAGCGTIFSMTPAGVLTTLYNFCSEPGCADGETPVGALIQDTNGTFYGTTPYGGADGDGIVYSMSVGLPAFVAPSPTAGRVGTHVRIIGTNLTGATSVTFNGTSATFTVVSGSEITTTVPSGATSGSIQVIVPAGTLTSNVAFRVGS